MNKEVHNIQASAIRPQLFEALAFCPQNSKILALFADLYPILSSLQASGRQIKIDCYGAGSNALPDDSSQKNDGSVTITPKGEWKPEYLQGGSSYDLVVADLGRVRSNLGSAVTGLRSALSPHGILSCSIPLGWNRHQEYPYFFSVDSSVRMMSGYGLIPISVSTVRDDVFGGYACLLICKLQAEYAAPHFDETRVLLKRYKFIPHTDPSFEFFGAWEAGGADERIAKHTGANFTWQGDANDLLLVCEHHPWSGIGEFHVRGKRLVKNLYSWYGHTQPEMMFSSRVGPKAVKLTGHTIGSDQCSLGTELVIHGVLTR